MKTRISDRIWLQIGIVIGLTLTAHLALAGDPPRPPSVPVVHILATDPNATERGLDTATFIVFRDGPTNASLNVRYSVAGSASNGVDYASLSGEVVIPVAASTASITIRPIDDALVEGGEVVALFLSQPIVWPPPYMVGWPGAAAAQIEDNDLAPTNRPPVVHISNPPDGAVFDGDINLRLIARASDTDGRVVSVEFFADGTSLGVVYRRPIVIGPGPIFEDPLLDLGGEIDPLMFPDLARDAAGNVVVNDDLVVLPLETFSLTWSNVPAGPHVLTAVATDNLGGSGRSDPVRIHVGEAPPQAVVSIKATDPVATEPDNNVTRLDTATFAVHRTGRTDLPLAVFYRIGGTAQNGIDYRELPRSVTIPAGARGTAIGIAPLPDKAIEGPESVVISLIPPVCIEIFPPPPECYLVGNDGEARAVINDHDSDNRPPVVEIVRPLDGGVFRAPADIEIVAQAKDQEGKVVTVEFFAGTRSLGRVTNDWTVLNPGRPVFALKWPGVGAGSYVLTAVATDDDGAQGRSRPVEIKVTEDFALPIVVIEALDPYGSEPLWPFDGLTPDGEDAANVIDLPIPVADVAIFTVKRDKATNLPLTVYYRLSGTASNGVDYRHLSGEVTIPAGQYRAPIYVVPLDDVLAEGTETIVIELTPLVCPAIFPPSPACYQAGDPSRAVGYIRDNDPELQRPKVEIVKPEHNETFPAGADIPVVAVVVDPDGYVSEVEFYVNDRRIGRDVQIFIVAPPPGQEQRFSIIWSNAPPGRYELTARATDSDGLVGRSAPVVIRVGADENVRPRVAIVQPETGDRFRESVDIPIVAQVLDPDGWVGLVEFFANDRKIGEEQIVFIRPPPPGQLQRFAMTWEKVPAGRYALTARATDDQGQTSLSGSVMIEVSASPGPPVVTIFAIDPLAREGAPLNPATFRIRRNGGTNEALTVHYAIRGTASNGVDYLRIPNHATIPAGRSSVRVTITPLEDRANERFETVVLRLENAALYNVGQPGRAGALILDNDCPRPDTCALPDRDFHLRRKLDGWGGYRVEVSEDLKAWMLIGSNVLNDEAVHFVDPEAGEWPRRFYRIVPCLEVDILAEE